MKYFTQWMPRRFLLPSAKWNFSTFATEAAVFNSKVTQIRRRTKGPRTSRFHSLVEHRIAGWLQMKVLGWFPTLVWKTKWNHIFVLQILFPPGFEFSHQTEKSMIHPPPQANRAYCNLVSHMKTAWTCMYTNMHSGQRQQQCELLRFLWQMGPRRSALRFRSPSPTQTLTSPLRLPGKVSDCSSGFVPCTAAR